MAKPILPPTGFSSASRRAFRKAVELAKRARQSLVIVHVIGFPGRHGRGRRVAEGVLLLGSVASRVLGTAPCPVLAGRAGSGA